MVIKSVRMRRGRRLFYPALSAALLITLSGCGAPGSGRQRPAPVTVLRIGFGLAAGGSPDLGIEGTAQFIGWAVRTKQMFAEIRETGRSARQGAAGVGTVAH